MLRRVLHVVLAWLAATTLASAQDPPAEHAGDDIGTAATGLPGLVRLAVPSPGPAGLRVSAEGGYGLTEAQAGRDGWHHRLAGQLAVGLSPTDFLAAAVRVDGRFDLHPDDGLGKDSTVTGDPRLQLRAGGFITPKLSLGLEAELWMPGQSPPSIDASAPRIEGRGLVGYHPAPLTTLVLSAGYRFDHSGRAVPNADALRIGDRMSLGLGDLNALPIGIGLWRRLGALEVMAELSGEVLLGNAAPRVSRMPYRLGLGTRYDVSHSVSWAVSLEVAPGKRASQSIGQPLVTLEPRAMLWTGLRLRFPFSASAAIEGNVAKPEVAIARPTKKPAQPPPPAPSAATLAAPAGPGAPASERATASVSGIVLDENGGGLGRVQLVVLNDDGAHEGTSKRDGRFRIDGIAPGQASITATRKGFVERTESIELLAGQVGDVRLSLQPDNPEGQLRGTVRSAGGEPLKATAKVYPGGKKTMTNGRGEFEVDVKPGEYTVRIRAYGYRSQNRTVIVRENGVVVLNVELRKK